MMNGYGIVCPTFNLCGLIVVVRPIISDHFEADAL